MKAVAPKTLGKLEYLVSTCKAFQKIRTAPKRYRVTTGAGNARFNVKVNIYFTSIEGAPVLNMVDVATHFSAAQFVEPLTTELV